jgi:hypothetical protein
MPWKPPEKIRFLIINDITPFCCGQAVKDSNFDTLLVVFFATSFILMYNGKLSLFFTPNYDKI